jgi:oxygen-independent coproporphyrinogen-3 oxidase
VENGHLLGYAAEEAFTHVFPGDRALDGPGDFYAHLDQELRATPAYHLWTYLPLCQYRCHFCQFPLLVINRHQDTARATAARWVDAIIAEAKLWLAAVPALRDQPIGEFCLFGGTPTVFPLEELERLVDFYRSNFGFTADTSMRAEGSPDTLNEPVLAGLRGMGFDKLTYGIQSFDDDLLSLANRRHTGQQAVDAARAAWQAGFARVDADLVWGLPGQDVDGFAADVQTMLDERFSTVVMSKLHLRSFSEVESAIGHVSPAVWENPGVRDRIAAKGYRWPSLGRQYQMRARGVELLNAAGYHEHPTTYFPHDDAGPQIWRSLNLDQARQAPEVGIGLGGYSWSSRAEANIATDPQTYLKAVHAGELPFETMTAVSDEARQARTVRMALSTCQPLSDDVHRERFGESLFTPRRLSVFESLQRRGLATIDHHARTVGLTPVGATLVEAIINTEIV